MKTEKKKVGRIRQFENPVVITFKLDAALKNELKAVSGLPVKFRKWAAGQISQKAKK